jgi:hypothetical protein
MKLYNWTLRVIDPVTDCFGVPLAGTENAAKEVQAIFHRASKAAGEKHELLIDWLSNIGCAVTNIVFFDPAPLEKNKINLILISPDNDLAVALREDKQKAPSCVNYFYTTKEWIRELPGESFTLQIPQWILGSLASSHIMLSNAKGIDSAFEVLLLPARRRFSNDPVPNIADLIAADIYFSVTQKLPSENSMRKMLPAFKKEMVVVSKDEMTRLAVRAMEKRCVKKDLREKVIRAFAVYR